MVKIASGNTLLDANVVISHAGLEEGMHVADLGCGGTGHFVFPVAKVVGSKGRAYAVDIMRPALEAIIRRKRIENHDNIKVIWSDIEIFNATKIESGSLDVAFLINTLYQSHKRAEILREAIRMLKKDGRLLVVEWKNITLPFGPPSSERVKLELLQKGANKLGLEEESQFFVGPYHYGIVFTKL
jgi:ubiquinone/menaquinone biosynthesis C-methylase UbiE